MHDRGDAVVSAPHRIAALALAVALLTGACGRGDANDQAAAGRTSMATSTALPVAEGELGLPTTVLAPLDLPGFSTEFDPVVCTFHATVANEAIGFGADSAVISDAGRAGLTELAGRLVDAVSVEVVGHTSTEGEEVYNQRLSERRAAAVAAELRSAQPDAEVTERGAGETQPIVVPDPTEAERARNRRVEVEAQIEAEVCA